MVMSIRIIFGYDLAWSDEVDGASLDPEVYTFEIGDGCPSLCGWGNEELQNYTEQNHSSARWKISDYRD